MHRPKITRWRVGAGLTAMLAAMAFASVVPIPTVPDGGRVAVRAEVADRLPGWTIQRLEPSWEGAYTVVTRCAGLELDFQYVPGHGLPSEDAWLHPSDAYARERLGELSDHRRHLIWRQDPARVRSLSCADELARVGEASPPDRNLD